MKVFSFIWSIVIKKLDFQNTSTQIQDHFLVKNVQMGVQNPYWCSVYFLNMCIRRFEMQYILYILVQSTSCCEIKSCTPCQLRKSLQYITAFMKEKYLNENNQKFVSENNIYNILLYTVLYNVNFCCYTVYCTKCQFWQHNNVECLTIQSTK